MTKEEFQARFSSITPIKIVWGEMDAAQHINNVSYFRYFETSRVQYLEDINFSTKTWVNGLGGILAYIDCKYIAPLTFPDTILVSSKTVLDSFEEHSFLMEQEIYSTKLNRVVAVSKSKIVIYDYVKLQKSPLPDYLKSAIIVFESNAKV